VALFSLKDTSQVPVTDDSPSIWPSRSSNSVSRHYVFRMIQIAPFDSCGLAAVPFLFDLQMYSPVVFGFDF